MIPRLATAALWLVCALAAFLATNRLIGWGHVTLDDLRYGRPRISVTSFDLNPPDAPGRPTRFFGVNLDRQVVVFQTDNNSAARTKVLNGPYLFGAGADLLPVVLSHADVNGDRLQDLLIDVDNEVIVYVNDAGAFRLANEAERMAYGEAR